MVGGSPANLGAGLHAEGCVESSVWLSETFDVAEDPEGLNLRVVDDLLQVLNWCPCDSDVVEERSPLGDCSGGENVVADKHQFRPVFDSRDRRGESCVMNPFGVANKIAEGRPVLGTRVRK